MGWLLLALTLSFEAAGIAWSYWFGSVYIGPGLVPMVHLIFPRSPLPVQYVGLVLVGINVLLHFVAILASVKKLLAERASLTSPGMREIQEVERIYRQLASSSEASILKHWPRSFRYNPGRGLQVRFIGRRLVIDSTLFKNAALKPLLAHQLAYYNSGDLWIRMVLSLLPPPLLALGVICGFGIGIGPFLTFLFWPWYWRGRVFAADLFAAHLGQKAALIDALDRLVRPREKRRNVFVREVPYVVERVDRLMRYQNM